MIIIIINIIITIIVILIKKLNINFEDYLHFNNKTLPKIFKNSLFKNGKTFRVSYILKVLYIFAPR